MKPSAVSIRCTCGRTRKVSLGAQVICSCGGKLRAEWKRGQVAPFVRFDDADTFAQLKAKGRARYNSPKITRFHYGGAKT